MSGDRWRSAAVLVGCALLVAACASEPRLAGRIVPVPDRPGLYALLGNEDLQRLDGTPEWEVKTWNRRSDFANMPEFVVYHPALVRGGLTPQQAVRLQKVAWLRSEIAPDGRIAPGGPNTWVESDLPEHQIPLEVHADGRRPELALVRPTRPLEPGLYSLQLRGSEPGLRARLGVAWSQADRTRYSGANCVDRYSGGETSYRPCAEQGNVLAESLLKKLKVHLVEPERRTANGQPLLVVRGVVVNTGDRPQRVPLLQARLVDSGGSTLRQWLITPDPTELAPGQSLPFRAEIPQPPSGTAKVNVNFLAADPQSGLIEARQPTRVERARN